MEYKIQSARRLLTRWSRVGRFAETEIHVVDRWGLHWCKTIDTTAETREKFGTSESGGALLSRADESRNGRRRGEEEHTTWLAEQMAGNCWKVDRDLGFWRRKSEVEGEGMKR